MELKTIEKLMELKKLYEAGVLTKEEVEAEKAKVLHAAQPVSESVQPAQAAEELDPDAPPLPMDNREGGVFNETVAQPATQGAPQRGGEGVSTKALLSMLIAVVFVSLVIAFAFMFGNSHTEEPYLPAETVAVAVDSCASSESHEVTSVVEDVAPEEENNTENEQAKIWMGEYTISGEMYRTCNAQAILSLAPSGGNRFDGSIHLMLGDEDDMGRFDFFLGILTGRVRGEAYEDGGVRTLRIYLGDFKVEAGSNGDFISPEHLQKGQLLFVLKQEGAGFSVEPMLEMRSFFSGITEDNTVFKR